MFGIQLVHQNPTYARHDKKHPLWLCGLAAIAYEPQSEWSEYPGDALYFATAEEALAALPDPSLVTTRVLPLPTQR